MMKINKTTVIAIGLILVLSSSATAAYAANLDIQDDVVNQITLVHDATWQGPVVSNGIGFGPFVQGSTTGAPEAALFVGQWDATTPTTPRNGFGVIHFVHCDGTVSDFLTATWNLLGQTGPTSFRYQIVVTVQSSGPIGDLGAVPAGFTGVQEPLTAIEISGLFETQAGPVTLPSDLLIQFVSDADVQCDDDDDDDDGGDDDDDGDDNDKGDDDDGDD